MGSNNGSSMQPISAAHLRLGQALRAARLAAGLSTRRITRAHPDFEYFSSGHISLVEHGRNTPSPELVDAYASFAPDRATIVALYEQMLAEAQELSRQKRGAARHVKQPPTRLDEVAGRRDVQDHYIVESNEAHYVFGTSGELERVDCVVLLRATRPDVTMYYAGHSYAADPRTGVLSTKALSGGSLAGTRESASGALQSYFELDRRLAPSDAEAHRLTFRVTVNSHIRCNPRLRYHAASGNQRMILHASFASTATPADLWRFGVQDVIDAEYAENGNLLSATCGTYAYQFEPLVPGWCYGFAWSWS